MDDEIEYLSWSGVQLPLKHVAGKVSLQRLAAYGDRAALLVPAHIPPTMYKLSSTGDVPSQDLIFPFYSPYLRSGMSINLNDGMTCFIDGRESLTHDIFCLQRTPCT